MKLDLIAHKEPDRTKRYLIVIWSMIFVCFVMLDGRNYPGLLKRIGMYDQLGWFFTTLLCLSFLGNFYMLYYVRRQKRRGSILFKHDYLTFEKDKKVKQVMYKDLNSLKIIQRTFIHDDKSNKYGISDFEKGNEVELVIGNERFQFQFKIDSYYQAQKIIRSIEALKKTCPVLEFIQEERPLINI